MQLTQETVKSAYREFAIVYGLPKHLQTKEKYVRFIHLIHRELSKMFTEENFKDGVTIAWQQATRLPVIANFYKGFDTPKGEPEKDWAEIKRKNEALFERG